MPVIRHIDRLILRPDLTSHQFRSPALICPVFLVVLLLPLSLILSSSPSPANALSTCCLTLASARLNIGPLLTWWCGKIEVHATAVFLKSPLGWLIRIHVPLTDALILGWPPLPLTEATCPIDQLQVRSHNPLPPFPSKAHVTLCFPLKLFLMTKMIIMIMIKIWGSSRGRMGLPTWPSGRRPDWLAPPHRLIWCNITSRSRHSTLWKQTYRSQILHYQRKQKWCMNAYIL